MVEFPWEIIAVISLILHSAVDLMGEFWLLFYGEIIFLVMAFRGVAYLFSLLLARRDRDYHGLLTLGSGENMKQCLLAFVVRRSAVTSGRGDHSGALMEGQAVLAFSTGPRPSGPEGQHRCFTVFVLVVLMYMSPRGQR